VVERATYRLVDADCLHCYSLIDAAPSTVCPWWMSRALIREKITVNVDVLESLRAILRLRRHRGIKSFEHELEAAGGVAGRFDAGFRTVPIVKVVGSVSRWRELGSDFFYRSGKGVTARFYRIGEAMKQGKILPPIEVYGLKRPGRDLGDQPPASEYYVVDGHHRVAMARKLGQDFLDAHVVTYKTGTPNPESSHPSQLETATSVEPGVTDLPETIAARSLQLAR
jgi:hypothetical protein